MQSMTDKEKDFLALALFSFSMKCGPKAFGIVHSICEQCGVLPQLEKWATDWINSAAGKQAAKLSREQYADHVINEIFDRYGRPE